LDSYQPFEGDFPYIGEMDFLFSILLRIGHFELEDDESIEGLQGRTAEMKRTLWLIVFVILLLLLLPIHGMLA
jgi:hypothetical protein